MQRRSPLRWRLAAIATSTFALTFVGAAMAGGGYALRQPTLASAGAIQENDCFTLVSTVGEPVAGAVTAGGYVLSAGFQATHEGTDPRAPDTLFRNGFDRNQGECSR